MLARFKVFRSRDRDKIVADYIERQTGAGAIILRGAAVDSLSRDLRSIRPGTPLTAPPRLSEPFFDDATRLRIADRFAPFLAVSSLLGRYSIRSRLPLLKYRDADTDAMFFDAADIDDDPADNNAIISFNEPTSTPLTLADLVKITTPEAALAYFRRLMVNILNAELFTQTFTGQAFHLAVTTDPNIRTRVAKVIEERMETGKSISSAPRDIEEILIGSRIHFPNNYGEMVMRTNIMESYRRGSWEEFNDPDVATFFPVWQYSGIPDGRERQGPMPERPDHHRWFGKYFDRSTSFFDVRGHAAADVIQCRCNFVPVLKRKWERLKAKGAVVTKWTPAMAYEP